jgi:Divergent InlB B-repeat domain
VDTTPLTVDVEGQGVVTSAPAGIDCGLECSAGYQEGEEVTLTATPTGGTWRFTGWTELEGAPGTCIGTTSPCRVTLYEPTKLKASFAPTSATPGEDKSGSNSSRPTEAPPATCMTDTTLCARGVLVTSHAARVRGGKALINARCHGEAGAHCSGTIRLVAKTSPHARRKVLVASAQYDLQTFDASRNLVVGLTAEGIRLLRTASITPIFEVSVNGSHATRLVITA